MGVEAAGSAYGTVAGIMRLWFAVELYCGLMSGCKCIMCPGIWKKGRLFVSEYLCFHQLDINFRCVLSPQAFTHTMDWLMR